METVGEILRREREKKGLTVKDVENATSIRALYISSIEEGNYSAIPGEVYLKGFIRNYANFLGLNGEEMVNLYRQSHTQQTIEPAAIKTEVSASAFPVKWLVAGVTGVIIAGAVWWFMAWHQPKSPAPEVKLAPVAPVPSPTVPAQPPQSTQTLPVPAGQPPAKIKPVVITAKYTDACWTSVTADGKEIYEGTPNAGDSFTWEAERNIVIKLGNAGGVELSHNGQSLGKLGAKGEVIVKSFAANTTTKP